MATAKLSEEALLAVLQAHPGLRERIASLVGAIENSEGDLEEADAAEERIVEEMRLLGREALQGWAEKQVEVTEREIRQQPHMHRQGKLECSVRAGFGSDSHVHAVGDGAPWIVGQVEQQFGAQGSYLIDFYHVCEYLSAAAEAIAPNAAAREAWMEAQKDALKTGRLANVLQQPARHFEAPDVDEEQAPVRRCHRYLSDRRNQLNHRDALAKDLPIGSGEIESAQPRSGVSARPAKIERRQIGCVEVIPQSSARYKGWPHPRESRKQSAPRKIKNAIHLFLGVALARIRRLAAEGASPHYRSGCAPGPPFSLLY
jgi:hypothetical protein